MSQSPHDVTVRWKPFRMRPDVGPDGSDVPPRWSHPQVPPRIKDIGASKGIDFASPANPRTPNTLLAHVLLGWALETGGEQKQNELVEAIFRQYHTSTLYPDRDNLVAAATECGLDANAARAALSSQERCDATAREVEANARVGGVPHFTINGKHAVHGAQPPDALLEAFDMA